MIKKLLAIWKHVLYGTIIRGVLIILALFIFFYSVIYGSDVISAYRVLKGTAILKYKDIDKSGSRYEYIVKTTDGDIKVEIIVDKAIPYITNEKILITSHDIKGDRYFRWYYLPGFVQKYLLCKFIN